MMKISTPIEETGFFWLPDEHNKRVPGILRISESGKVTLEITIQSHSGSPSEPNDSQFFANYIPFNRILGMTESGSVTLENCSLIGPSWNRSSTFTKEIIQGDIAFMGEEYGKDREITFSAVDFSIEGLDEWLGIPVGTVKHELQGNRSTSITYSPPEPIIIPLPGEGMKLSLSFSFSTPLGFNIKETKITQKAFIWLESEELRPLDDFLEVVNRLHRFLCFAIGKTVSMTPTTGYSWEVTQKIGRSEKEQEIPIRIFYEGMPTFNDNSKVVRHHMLFTYEDVRDQLDTIINEWLTNYKEFKPVFDLFFGVRFKADLYVEWQFLSYTQSIEALHRMRYDGLTMPKNEFEARVKSIIDNIPDNTDKVWLKKKLCHANELTLRQRLKEMFEPFLDIYGKEKVHGPASKPKHGLISKIVRMRNLLTHAGSKTENIDPIRLHALFDKLDALLQLHFLDMIGMDSALIGKLIKKRNRSGLREKITWSEEDYSIL